MIILRDILMSVRSYIIENVGYRVLNYRFLKRYFSWGSEIMHTTISFIRGSVVEAVIDAVAHVLPRDAATIVACKLCVWVAGPKRAAFLITVITTVVIVITAVVVRHTPAISTGIQSRLTGVKSCQ